MFEVTARLRIHEGKLEGFEAGRHDDSPPEALLVGRDRREAVQD